MWGGSKREKKKKRNSQPKKRGENFKSSERLLNKQTTALREEEIKMERGLATPSPLTHTHAHTLAH